MTWLGGLIGTWSVLATAERGDNLTIQQTDLRGWTPSDACDIAAAVDKSSACPATGLISELSPVRSVSLY